MMSAISSIQKRNDNTVTYKNPKMEEEDMHDLGPEELVGTNPEKRNWRGILIAVLVILIVFSLIILAVILVSPKESGLKLGEPFTFEDMFNSDFQPRHFSAQWLADKDVLYYRSREGEVMEHNAELNKTVVIMDNSTFRSLNTDVYFVSVDLAYVLIAYDIEQVFRHSFKAKYKIYNRRAANPKEKLIPFPQDANGLGSWESRKLQFAGWGPVGSTLTFIYDNNLYYQADPFTTPTAVTNSPSPLIFNGISDWLYEEEVIHSHIAHWLSPSAKAICYAEIDDTKVPRYSFPIYGDGTSIYGLIDDIAYPKAGDKEDGINPVVRLYVVDTANLRGSRRELQPPRAFRSREYYFTSVVWQDDNHVLVVWTNRVQNVSIARLCDTTSADCYDNLEETSKEGNGWVDFPKPLFIEGGQTYLTVLPVRDGNLGYWKHIVMVTAPHSIATARKTWVTQGPWDISEIVGFDETNKHVYYLTSHTDPRKKHLYRVGISHRDALLMTPQCMSCDYDEDCQYVSASFSHSAHYYILHCLGPMVPRYILKSTLDDRDIVVEDNAEFKARLAKKALPKVEFHEIETEEGHKIWAKVLLPPTLNKEHITLYPLLVHTYAGPGSQRVTLQFHIGWETYLTSSEHVVYMNIDGRGSAGRGNEWLHQVYKHLGTKEVQDQISGAKYMKDNFAFVDKERMAIWGWSYGGFVTSHALGDPGGVFGCGVAVAPVTDWRYYDTAYTERYMGLAHSNANYRGYDNANVSRKAKNFKGKHFMIVHGTADDNVHFQHTAQLIKALTEADVDFRVQVYSDKKHGLDGPKTSRHLYRTMTSFLIGQCWKGGRLRRLDGDGQAVEIAMEE